MVIIRLSRGGAKKRPFYHIIATDKRSSRDGRNIERLGYFNPIAQGQDKRLCLDLARVEYWVGTGAQPSDRVASLIKEARKLPPESLLPETRRMMKKPVAKMPPKPKEVAPEASETTKGKKASGKGAPKKTGAGKGKTAQPRKPKTPTAKAGEKK